MIRHIIVFVMLSYAATTYAQEPILSFQSEYAGRNMVGAYGGITATSSDFSNRFVGSLISDDQLEPSLILDQLSIMDADRNKLGMDYESGVIGSWNVKNGPHSLLFRASDGAHIHFSTPKNAMALVFQGNKPFAGDTLDFSNISGLGMRYQQLSIGWSYNQGIGASIWAMASFVNGQQMAEIDISRSWLYTGTLGDTLGVGLTGTGYLSDTSHVGFAKPSGIGGALDFGLNRQFQGDFSDWIMRASVQNLGINEWSSRTIQADVDTNLNWYGVEINDLLAAGEQFEGTALEDSLTRGIDNSLSKGRHYTWLPGAAQVDFVQLKDKGLELGGGAVVRWNAGYNPFAYGRIGYRFNTAIALHSTIGYGGYGAFQMGIRGGYVSEHIHAGLAINNLEALIVPSQFAGGSLNFHFSYLF